MKSSHNPIIHSSVLSFVPESSPFQLPESHSSFPVERKNETIRLRRISLVISDEARNLSRMLTSSYLTFSAYRGTHVTDGLIHFSGLSLTAYIPAGTDYSLIPVQYTRLPADFQLYISRNRQFSPIRKFQWKEEAAPVPPAVLPPSAPL